MLAAYFDQFNVIRLVTIQAFHEDWLITFTNSSMMMVLAIIMF